MTPDSLGAIEDMLGFSLRIHEGDPSPDKSIVAKT